MQHLTVSIIQTKLFWEDKKANLDMLEKKISMFSEHTELVVLPEMFSTGFSMKPDEFAENMEGETVTWMRKMAKEKKVILTGSIIIEENKKFYNRLIWMLPSGDYGFYDKRHLFGFAKEDQHYAAGNKRLIAGAKGWKINLLVCYDLRFPVWSRQSQKDNTETEFDLLIYVANWPERRKHAWKTLLTARAIENQCYVIGVNRVGEDGNNICYSGNSMIIDPLGEVLCEKENDEDIITLKLDPSHLIEVRSKFPFLKDGDHFILRE